MSLRFSRKRILILIAVQSFLIVLGLLGIGLRLASYIYGGPTFIPLNALLVAVGVAGDLFYIYELRKIQRANNENAPFSP